MPQVAIPLLVSLALSVAISFISRALAPKPKRPGDRETGRKHVVRSSVEAHQIIYGTAMVSGPLVFAESTGTKNRFLNLVVALAAHEVEGIDSVWLNDVELTNANLDGSGLVIAGRFKERVLLAKALGTATQPAILIGDNWTSVHQGKGIAYVYALLDWNIDVFPTGIPNIRVVSRGRKVWDPRLDPGDVLLELVVAQEANVGIGMFVAHEQPPPRNTFLSPWRVGSLGCEMSSSWKT